MLNEIEDTFRVMKSEFSIRTRLKQVGVNHNWETIRELLSTHRRVTNRMRTKEGKTIYIRKCSNPEYFHQTIYDALKNP